MNAPSNRMPTLFVPHGAGPCFFMDWDPVDAWDRMRTYLENIATTLPERPGAILVISGHWLEANARVTAHPHPSLIFDYHGFPEHTYRLSYPAPGEPVLADTVVALLHEAGIPAEGDPARGLDHGVFVPLKLMFPEANIPVVQLSLRRDLDAQAHLDLGRALAPLRDRGVLIVGSGMSFHNMRGYRDPRFTPISEQFDAWLVDTVTSPGAEREAALRDWAQAPSARLSHPPRAEEHLLPLLVAAGAAGESTGRRIFSDRVMETALSGFQFG